MGIESYYGYLWTFDFENSNSVIKYNIIKNLKIFIGSGTEKSSYMLIILHNNMWYEYNYISILKIRKEKLIKQIS